MREKHFNINDWQPYRSHEFIKDVMDYTELPGRGFIVGCHGENISTTYSHRYKGRTLEPSERDEIFVSVGILNAPPISFKPSMRYRVRKFINYLPFRNVIKRIYHAIPNRFKII